jgi:hypothetical protein
MSKEQEERLIELLRASEQVLRDAELQQREIAATLASAETSRQHTDPILRRAGLLK